MSTMLIACNETRQSGSFMGDQLCSLRVAYLFAEHTPGVDRILMSCSRANEMHFLWEKFIRKYDVQVLWDEFDPGNWAQRHSSWDAWRLERRVDVVKFDHYRELYLRIHGMQRQTALCGAERGLGRRNIYQYWWCGQENSPEELPVSVDWFDDTLVDHPALSKEYDVYISPLAKTQGNYTFTFDFWSDVIHRLVDAGVSVTCGWDQYQFCAELDGNPMFRRHWGDHKQWMDEVCRHRLVACGNTGTGWLAAACGVPMVTMEPPNSQMPDHRYERCNLRNVREIVTEPDAAYVARRIREECHRGVVMTTGCYDILHAGHVRHLERARAMGTHLIVALNSDESVAALKGHLQPPRPINTVEQRRAVLEALRCVDEVRVFDGPDALPLIEEVRPDILACGFGYTEDTVVGRDVVEKYGGKVAITCRGDATDEPSTTKIAHRSTPSGGKSSRSGTLVRVDLRNLDIADLCRAAVPYSVNPYDKLKLMADEFLKVCHLSGDVADLGCYRGGTSLVLNRLAPEKHLHLFDTWRGTPYDDPLCHHKTGEWSASLEDCKALVGTGNFVRYYEGVFPYTAIVCDVLGGQLASVLDGGREFCFVYVDMDTERATRDAIKLFWPRLQSGGVMVFDDYGWEPCAGVKVAVDETFSSSNLTIARPLYTCVVEKP